MIIKMNYVNKLATEILSEYISKGYVLSSTMSGHQGEVYKVDVYKDNEIVSTLLSQISWSNNIAILSVIIPDFLSQ